MPSQPLNGHGHAHGFTTEPAGTRGPAANGLRRKLLAALNAAELPARSKTKVLNECRSQFENRRTVEGAAAEAGLTLLHFLTNDALELYYEIKRGRHDLGYISKGWDDPGFRVGEVLAFQELQGVHFIWTGPEIKRYCATNGIGITFEQQGETTTLYLDGVIYAEGFNHATFLHTLEAINQCVEHIESLAVQAGGGSTGGNA
jgi:hypothetical protein